MRRGLLLTALLLGVLPVAARAQISLGISLPGVRIGLNLPVLPQLVRVPGSPAYYAPGVGGNYFYYEDRYWVYERDSWYASTWYNGPWSPVDPEEVPVFVLRIPVRYYRAPPSYFRGWRGDAPPRWGEHWGAGWQQRRPGWDRWDRRDVPAPAPLPSYQQPYRGNNYPGPERQQELHRERQLTRPQEPPPAQRQQAPRQGPQQHPQREDKGEGRGEGRGEERGPKR